MHEGRHNTLVVRCTDQRQRRKRHGVITAARLIEEQLEAVTNLRRIFVTLTYRPGAHWMPYDITRYLNELGAWAARRDMGVLALWVAEHGKLHGRLHYHLVLWVWRLNGRRTPGIPLPDRAGHWRKGMSNVCELHNPVGYIAKYVAKANPQGFAYPHGMHLWGARGLRGDGLQELRWWRAPPWVRKLIPLEEGAKRLKGGWWGNRSTKWCYRTPWRWDPDKQGCWFAGWEWQDVCLDGTTWAELCGSG